MRRRVKLVPYVPADIVQVIKVPKEVPLFPLTNRHVHPSCRGAKGFQRYDGALNRLGRFEDLAL